MSEVGIGVTLAIRLVYVRLVVPDMRRRRSGEGGGNGEAESMAMGVSKGGSGEKGEW